MTYAENKPSAVYASLKAKYGCGYPNGCPPYARVPQNSGLKNSGLELRSKLPKQATSVCCILRGPDREHILDVVLSGTELGTQVKTGSRAGSTHSQ